jgi:exodeoxyribonuclease VII small subunit
MERDQDAATASGVEADSLDYEGALSELDAVLTRLEDGRVPLEEAMALYERGVGLVRRCSGLLEGAERRVLELSAGPEGSPEEAPFEAAPEEESGSGAG